MSPLRYHLAHAPHAGAPTVLFSAGLGGLADFWQPQIAALGPHAAILTYDHRGTGRNAQPLDTTSIADMADDIVGILDHAGLERVDFVGHALGAAIGLAFAHRHPHRLRRLVLVNGWGVPRSVMRRCFAARLALLDHVGPEAYVRAQPIFLYPAWWLAAHPERAARIEAHGLEHFPGAANTRARIAALLAYDATPTLHAITAPTLVAAAVDDVLVPYLASERLADHLRNAELWLTERGGHAFTVTVPDPFNARLQDFLLAP